MEHNPYRTNPDSPGGPPGPDASLVDIRQREYSFNDLLTVTFAFLVRNWRDFVAPAVGYALFLGAGQLLSFYWVLEFLENAVNRARQVPVPGKDANLEEIVNWLVALFWDGAVQFMPYVVAFMAAFLLVKGIFTLMNTHITAARMAGRPTGPAVQFGAALRDLGVYALVSLLAGILTAFGVLLCYVPGLILMVFFSLLAPLVAVGRQGLNALPACFRLLENRFWKTLGVYFVIAVGCYGVIYMLSLPFSMFGILQQGDLPPSDDPFEHLRATYTNWTFFASSLVSTIGGTVLYLVLDVAATILYVNYSRPSDQAPRRTDFAPPPVSNDHGTQSPYA